MSTSKNKTPLSADNTNPVSPTNEAGLDIGSSPAGSPTTSKSTHFIIAPTKAEQEAHKRFEKKLATLSVEQVDKHGNVVSMRNEDHFFNGPLDGQTCTHQPNGPEAKWDKGRYWADYFIKDSMIVDFKTIPGYHIYSSARSIFDGDYSVIHTKAGRPQTYLGTRTANMRKCYYYCGFMEEEMLILDGISPLDFVCVLTMS